MCQNSKFRHIALFFAPGAVKSAGILKKAKKHLEKHLTQ